MPVAIAAPTRSASSAISIPAPASPAMSDAQLVSASFPSGETMPTPVTTTLRLPLSELTCLPVASSHAEAAVDEQHLACDERRLVRAEEAYRPGHVLRVTQAAERRVREHRLRRVLRQHVRELRLDVAR